MSDYSYYVVTKEPPTPALTIFNRIESYFRDVKFATEGAGRDDFGPVISKRHWTLRRGLLRRSGIDHTFAAPAPTTEGGQQ